MSDPDEVEKFLAGADIGKSMGQLIADTVARIVTTVAEPLSRDGDDLTPLFRGVANLLRDMADEYDKL